MRETRKTQAVAVNAPVTMRAADATTSARAAASACDCVNDTAITIGARDGALPGTFGSRFRDALAGEAAKRLGRGKDR